MSTDTLPRDHLVRALYADLIGPYQLDEDAIAEQELLELPPARDERATFGLGKRDAFTNEHD